MRIELMYTDLQSFAFLHKNNRLDRFEYQDICRTRCEPDTLVQVGPQL